MRKFVMATSAIEEIEHYNFKHSEEILESTTSLARDNIENSVDRLNEIVDEADLINFVSALVGSLILILYLTHVKSSFIQPVKKIGDNIDAMRSGKRDVVFNQGSSTLEVREIASNLNAFQNDLIDLEKLRDSQRVQAEQSHLAALTKAYSELEERERKQRETAEELLAANRDLEQFVHIASHDLREPLKKISSFIQMMELELEGSINEKGAELVAVIKSNARSMCDLIDDLRTLTRIYDSSLEITQCNLDSIIQIVLSNYAEQLEGRKTSLNISKLPVVPGFQNLLTQVFLITTMTKLCYTVRIISLSI